MRKISSNAAQHFILDPKEFVVLYYRCVRCLYLRVRADDTARSVTDTLYADAVQFIEAATAKNEWLDVGGKQFCLGSPGNLVVSEPAQFKNMTVSVVAKNYAIIEMKDGTVRLARFAYESERVHILELEADAFALENPAENEGFPIEIAGFAIIDFVKDGPSPGKLRPTNITLLGRQAKRFHGFMAVVSHILGAPKAPPADAFCEQCEASERRA